MNSNGILPVLLGLLSGLGSGTVPDGLNYDPGYTLVPAPSLRSDQVTTAMGGMIWAFGAGLVPGSNDKPLIYNLANTVPWMVLIRPTWFW
jgi:hypothetical protein